MKAAGIQFQIKSFTHINVTQQIFRLHVMESEKLGLYVILLSDECSGLRKISYLAFDDSVYKVKSEVTFMFIVVREKIDD